MLSRKKSTNWNSPKIIPFALQNPLLQKWKGRHRMGENIGLTYLTKDLDLEYISTFTINYEKLQYNF